MPMTRPRVSVIIPTYNHGRYVGEAVRSALAQTYQRIEVIVIDDCSQDNTQEILARIDDPRLRVFRPNHRGIIAAVRNFGIQQAMGDVFAFLDADDVWLPDKLECQLPHLENGVSIVATDFIPFGDMDSCTKLIRFGRREDHRDLRYSDLALENCLATSTVIIRRDAFEKAGGFDESPDFMLIEDWELWLRMTADSKARILNKLLAKYRIILNKGRDRRNIARRALRVLEKHRELGLLSSERFKTALAHRYVHLGGACLEANDLDGLTYYRYALLHAGTTQARLRALAGLIMFCIPGRLRENAMRWLQPRRYGKSQGVALSRGGLEAR